LAPTESPQGQHTSPASRSAGTISARFTADAGESLEQRIVSKEGIGAAGGWEDHAATSDTAQLFAIIFMVVLVAYILVPFFAERRAAKARAGRADNAVAATRSLPRWVSIVLAVLVVAASVGTVATVIIAGHSRAKAVWCETNSPPDCQEGG